MDLSTFIKTRLKLKGVWEKAKEKKKKKILIVAGNLMSGTLVSATSAQCHSSVVIEGGRG